MGYNELSMEKNFEVWIEGYAATGEYEKAQFLGKYKSKSFKGACMLAMIEKKFTNLKTNYEEKINAYWRRKFFDNENDARKSNG